MKKLNKKKRSLLLSLGCVALSVFSFGTVLGFSGCGDEDPVTCEHDGSYYLSAVDGEYSLSMSVGKCTLTVGNVTKFGSYENEGDTFQFMFEDGTTATGSVANGSLSLVYNEATLVFLKKVDYTVSYSVDGAVASTQKVLNGKMVSRPADPVKSGYYFVGWYTDAEFKNVFNFDGAPVLADVTLYARFVEAKVGQNEFNVTYIVDGEEVKEQSTKGGVVYDLPTPSKAGATFVGWWVSDYQDGAKLTYQYTGQELTESTNLYAVWASASAQVSVDQNGVKWNALGAGTNYTVSIYLNGTKVAEQKTSSLEYAYDFTTKTAGDYVVEVAANGATTTVYYQNKALDRVSLFTVAEPSVLVYNAVENAEKYLITVDCGNDVHVHTELDNGSFTSFNFANCEMQEGGITFTVKAIANGYLASESETFTYSRDLDAITGVTFDNETGVLCWNSVAKATSYKVEVTVGENKDVHEVYGTSFSLAQYTGAVSVKVYAVANGYNSSEISYNYTCEKLVAPTGLKVNYNTVKWNAVSGATKYNVRIGSNVYPTTATEYALPDAYKVAGSSYEVSVQAVGATETANSYYSKALSVKYGMFENVYYGNGALNWGNVGGAYKYVVTINDDSVVNGSATEFAAGTSASELVFRKAGSNKVEVKALDYLGQELDKRTVYVETTEVSFDTRTAAGVTKLYKAVGDKMEVASPELEGYDFVGWYNVPAPLGSANNGVKFENMVFTGVTANAFYACWSPKAFEVTLKVGEEVVGTATVYYGREYTLQTVKSPDAAKTFGGWFAQDGSQGRQYTNPNGESANVWDSVSESTVLYAGWIDVLDYEEISDATVDGGKAYQVKKAAGIEYVKEVTIPETYNGKPVTTIAPNAFEYCANLETVNIPDTIKYISINTGSIYAMNSSFYKCSNLKNINVYCVDDEHTESADHETYFSSIDGVLIRHGSPNAALEYGVELAFFPAARTGEYTVPSGVNYIPQNAFYKSSLTSVVIPATVARIGKQAFKESKLLETVTFTEAQAGEEEAAGLVLENNVFGSCSVLTSVAFPSRLNETAFKANSIFLYSFKVTELTVSENAQGKTKFYTANKGMLCNADGDTLLYCPTGRVGKVEIPVAIEEIGAGAFDECTKITEVVIGDNVRAIGANAFNGCNKLTTVDFRGETGTMEIAEKAFYGCSVLADLVIPKNVTKIGKYAFGNTTNLKNVTLNGGANIEYADSAFANTDGLGYVTHLTIGATLGSFEINGVFKGCEIEKVELQGGAANPNYEVTQQGVLYTTGKAKLLFYPFGQTETTFTFDEKTTEIGAGAFYNKTNLESINIPATITVIGADAFKGAIALATVTFAPNRTANLTIGANAFDGCSSLTAVDLPEKTVSLGDHAFNKCMSLASVKLPTTLTSLEGSSVFAECSKLASIDVATGNQVFAAKSGILYAKEGEALTEIKFIPTGLTGEVVLPKTLKSIAASQFKSNTGITKISFEDDTTTNASFSIGASAFEDMKALTAINLPNNLKVIPDYAFKNSKNLTAIEVPKTVTSIGKGAFLSAAKLVITFEEGGTEDLTIAGPASGSESKDGAFYGVKAAAIALPERMTQISSRCFYQSSITSITIPSTVAKIGDYAFANCKSLAEIVFAKNEQGARALTEVCNNAFYSCSALTEVTIPGSITKMTMVGTGSYHQMFYSCAKLKTVYFEEGITVLGSSMFHSCKALEAVKTVKADGTIVDGLPSSIQTAGIQTFYQCNKLATITIPANMKVIPNSFLYSAAITSLTIPASVTDIDKSAFYSCKSLANVTFETGSKITSIGDQAFAGTAITSINVPQHAEVAEITFGTSIFENCTSLTSATIASTVKNLNNAFLGCSALTTISYSAEGTQVDAENKLILDESGTIILLYFGAAETFDVPATVTEIGKGAFAGRTTLKTVNIHQEVTTIGDNAFKGAGLTAVNFIETAEKPSKINKIGASAFEGTQLVELVLPASLVVKEAGAGDTFGSGAFKKITTLTSATVKGTAMGASMFEGCSALANVTLNSAITTFKGKTFMGTGLTSITLPTSLATVGASEFENCTKLDNVVIPTSLTVPGNYMFSGCTSLTTITLHNAMTKIAPNMFNKCAKLATIKLAGETTATNKLPESVTTIGTYAFNECAKLTTLKFPNGLTTIEQQYTFTKTGLTELDLSNTSVTASGNALMGAFTNMTSLATVKFPSTVTGFYAGAFNGTKNIVTFIAPGLTAMNMSAAFKNSKKLTTVEVPNAVSVGASCFEGCSKLTQFDFSKLKTIGNNAFKGTGITSVELGDDLTSIGNNAFASMAISEITIPKNVTTIGTGVFAGCSNLAMIKVDPANANFRTGEYGELYNVSDTLVAFPAKSTGNNGLVEIAEGVQLSANAFEGATGIQYVKLPSTLVNVPDKLFLNSGVRSVVFAAGTRSLGVSVFEGCTSLEMIEFPDSIAEIGNYTFRYCTSLTKVVLPRYLEVIPNRMFMGCTSLTEVTIPELLRTIDAGAFMESGITSVDCGDHLEVVGFGAFQKSALQSISLGTSLKKIDALAFSESPIQSITIPASIVEIGMEDMRNGLIAQCFMDCTELETVVFEGAPQIFYKEMFKGCTALNSVTLNGEWKEIPEGTFQGCTSLTSITIPATVETIGKNAFAGAGLTSVVIPASVKTLGSELPQGGGGIPLAPRAGMVVGPTTTTNSLVFANCASLKTVVFEGVPTNMYGGTFKGCTALESVTLNGNWTKIEESMFDGCTSLTNFTVPASVTTIGAKAFNGWTSAQVINVPDKTQAEATAAWGATWFGSATVNYKQEQAQA